MSINDDQLNVPQGELVQAWQHTLPERLTAGDQADVMADESDPTKLLVHIRTAGRQMLEFDFSVQYVDSREIDIQLSDVERDGQSVDERTDVMQELISDYRRHLHECAQALHHFTNA
ncbi:hypothetical protein [Cohnella nanjingensis]|uniref:Uncharacterized protein n=1 Tax=Cohnella nanjingensis TaxID=1387779 RepID=A0A7X0RPS3_9BACL|nr:hypothetical protein [Cohnella nanjingensis]MBB6670185.1 hypothetical protein [Cohnella nanjingensis]